MQQQSTRPKVRYKTLKFMGYPYYAVGTDGSVWGRKTTRGPAGKWRRKSPMKNKDGRLYVQLFDGNNNKVTFKVHQLVLLAFVGPPPEGKTQVRHFPDPNPHNNRLENLQWGNQSDNEKDKVAHGTSNRGEQQGRAKLTESDVRRIRKLHTTGRFTHQQLADEYKVHRATVSLIIRRVNWYWLED